MNRTGNMEDISAEAVPPALAWSRALYKKSYGAWAGDPAGRKPDYERCCEPVWSRDRWAREFQCTRPRGYGADGAYCKQHDPEATKARRAKLDAAANAKWNKERYNWYGRKFYDALARIAEGHNDARGLAQEVIDEFKSGERK